MEPSVAETIDFDFFHPVSGLGQIELGEEDWRLLSERLAGRQFDLAVDLRKHPETRPVLRHTGARYLAGFDHRNLFGWLDIALEWGGDEALARKRQHTSDDLVNLVDAIAAACEDDRQVIVAPRTELAPALAREIKRSADRPLVCVHPCAGNETRRPATSKRRIMVELMRWLRKRISGTSSAVRPRSAATCSSSAKWPSRLWPKAKP